MGGLGWPCIWSGAGLSGSVVSERADKLLDAGDDLRLRHVLQLKLVNHEFAGGGGAGLGHTDIDAIGFAHLPRAVSIQNRIIKFQRNAQLARANRIARYNRAIIGLTSVTDSYVILCVEKRQNNTKGRQGFQRTHGLSKLREYAIWNGIKQRCHNANFSAYEKYGGRGITMCDEWRESFEAFYRDVGPRPSPQHSVERDDNHRGYEPGNCRWATLAEQADNKRRTIRIDGKTLNQIAAETGIPVTTIRGRHYQGNADRVRAPGALTRRDAATMNKGAANGQAKLTEDGVRAMRSMRAQGMQLKDIAPKFGVSKSLVGLICRRERWGWLD